MYSQTDAGVSLKNPVSLELYSKLPERCQAHRSLLLFFKRGYNEGFCIKNVSR